MLGSIVAGTLSIQNGGRLTASSSGFGYLEGSSGSALISGANSAFSLTANLDLGMAGTGTLGIALRRFRQGRGTDAFALPSAAVTRWRVSMRPSVPLAVPGIGRARWLLELTRCRAGEAAKFEVEASDAEGRIAFSSGLADRSPETGAWRLGASA